ncbi:MAG: porin family protein [Alistipes sp.]|nr:porin family protein [Alistipes sp.]
MKKILLSMVAFVAMTTASYAQLGWGVKAGFNVSGLSGMGQDSKLGLTAGVFADYRLNGWFGVSADLLFSREGAKWSSDNSSMTQKCNYLNLPILANFFIMEDMAFKVGIQPGVNLSDKIKIKADGHEITNSNTGDFKAFAFAIPVGLSYEFADKIMVDARYNIGVSSILNENKEVRTNGFALTVGYRF